MNANARAAAALESFRERKRRPVHQVRGHRGGDCGPRRLYIYQGLLVQVQDGKLTAVRCAGELVPARTAPRGTAPLPKHLRAQARTLTKTAALRAGELK